jgi:chemotaxis signal transduction protein/ABC-type nitrate/sulfonate/bicarbonate transport system substrate-binding protein/CheY-like chemotaxis protein
MTIDPRTIKVLLVEDAATMRKIEKMTLKSLGYENIIEAENGVLAVQILEENDDIDLIISDWNMPEKDGYELLCWIRANDRYKTAPFLMATGQGDMKQEKKAIDAGVSAFVAKPFNADELKEKIEEAYGLNEEKDEEAEARPRETESGKVLLRVAHIQITDHLVLGVLQHLIQAGEIEPKLFELDTLCMPGWNPVRQALEKGTVDAACILAPIAMDLFGYGVPIRLTLLAHKNGSIFVRNKQGDYREPFEQFFQNKSFYIPHKMSIHHMLAHLFFTRIGLQPSMQEGPGIDVNFEVVAPIKMPEFLKTNSDSCGFMVAEPLGTKSIAAGIAEPQFLSSELWDNHPCCVVAMRDDFIEPYTDAVYEFTELLVQAGQFIEKKPEKAAEIGVAFLDPERKLGLKVPLLKNVLTEAQGIRTGDLFPNIQDLDRIQQYMYHDMGIGSIIDLEKFVDTRFAMAACRETKNRRPGELHDDASTVGKILRGSIEEGKKNTSKSMLNIEGKYLTFSLGEQEFGIDILKIKEIVGMMPIRSIPQSPSFVKGVVNLRGKVIPVMDIRSRFGMSEIEQDERNCIIILEFESEGQQVLIGIMVDSVSEVADIKAADIEETPFFGSSINTSFILGMGKVGNKVKILLDMDHVVGHSDLAAMNRAA